MKPNKYISTYKKFLEKSVNISRPLRVFVDAGNGTTGPIIESLKIQNLSLTIINKKPDGNFPSHSPNPNSLPSLTFKKKLYDFGVAFDGDGDRAVFFDEEGKKISPHKIAYLLFLKEKPPFVADPIIRALFLYSHLSTSDIYESIVGSPHIKSAMRKINASVGAEYSGHYYFKSCFGFDSGIFAFLQCAQVISKLPYSLKTFSSLLGEPIIMETMQYEAKNHEHSIRSARALFHNMAEGMVEKDGISFFFNSTFLYIRPSHTESIIRVYIIAHEKQKANHIKNMVHDLFE